MAPRNASSLNLTQSTLSFGTSKASAAAHKVKKASAKTTPIATSSVATSNAPNSPIEIANDADTSRDDISEVVTVPGPSDSETEDGIEDARPQLEDKSAAETDDAIEPVEEVETIVVQPSTSAKDKSKPSTASKPAKVTPGGVPASHAKSVPAVEEIDVQSRPHLVVKDKAYNGLYAKTKEAQSYLPPVHAKDQKFDRVQEILRTFDMSDKYGPCVGMSRLERWKRAKAMKLNPPKEIYDILTTQEGLTQTKYSADVLTGQI